jgi:hypothetical protein
MNMYGPTTIFTYIYNLVIQSLQTRLPIVAEYETQFPDSVICPPNRSNWWLLAQLTRLALPEPPNLSDQPPLGMPNAAKGRPRFGNACRQFILDPKESPNFLNVLSYDWDILPCSIYI